jgi:peptide/nickel transport system substrate-binding protein
VWVGLPGHLSSQSQTSFRTPLPHHVLGTMTAAQILAGDYGRQPLGWGPFRLLEWVPGSHITLERNPYYWRPGYPKLDRVTFRFPPDSDQLYGAMLRGEIHVASNFTGMPWDRVAELLDPKVTPTIRLEWSPSTVVEQMSFGIVPADSRYPVFADPRVRRALAHAIDRQRIIDAVLYGLGSPPPAYIFEEHPLYPTTLTTYPYDPVEAAALLDAAGWMDTTGNGIRDKDGNEFVITYQTSTDAMRIQVGYLIREDLAAVGIQLDVVALSAGDFFAGGPDGPLWGRQFDLATFAWLSHDIPPCALFITEGIPNEANGWSGSNVTGYSNPAYDAACRQAMNSLPGTAEYVQGHQAALEIFTQDLPVLPLYIRPKVVAVSSGFSVGPKTDPSELKATWNIWEWDLTTSTTAEPDTPATLVAPNHILTATFGADTFAETTVITYTNLPSPRTPTDLVGVGRFFALEASSAATGQPISPQTSYELEVTYAQASVPRHMDESTLALYIWNGTQWVREPTSEVDLEANVVTARPDHFSIWAVLGETSHSVYLPLIHRGH